MADSSWFQVVLGKFWVGSGVFSWFQVVSDDFRWLRVVLRFSMCGLDALMDITQKNSPIIEINNKLSSSSWSPT